MFTNIKIKTRLAVGYSLLALAVLVVSIMAFMALSKAQDAFTHQVDSIELVGKLSNDINDNASARAIGARNLVIATSQAAMEYEVSAIKAAHKKMGEDLGKIKSKVSSMPDATVGLRSALDKVEATELKYGPIALEITRLGSIGEKDAAIQKINMECRPLLAELIKELHQLQDEIQKISQTSVDASNSEFKALRLVLIGVGIVVVLMALFLGITTTRSIINPLNKAVASTRSIAGGDLNQTIDAPGNDEISELLKSLEAMRVSLSAVVANVRQGSESVATASSEIAQGNHDLSARTEQQASALEQTAASMEELGSTVKHNADNAKQANQLAMNAAAVAVKGGEVVGQAVETMKGINESSRKIADIISVIDGIAFQTNILALNAAVEAARAGEQGRGFAVVASEVRALAGRSADAAKEIKSLITSSVERVEQGSSQVDAAGATMAEVVHSIKRVTDIMGEISAASNEQAMGVAQVGEAVTLMDQATQQNAALVEEMAAAASSLKSQAQDLVQVVAVFKVEEQAGTFSRSHSAVQPMNRQLGNSFKSIAGTKKMTPKVQFLSRG